MITDRSKWSKCNVGLEEFYRQDVTFSDGTEISVYKEILDNRVRYGDPGFLNTFLTNDWYNTYEDAVEALYLEKYGD